MSDDLTKKGPPDSKTINLTEQWEIDYWTKKFGVSLAKLKQAVAAVGKSSSAVQEWLKKN